MSQYPEEEKRRLSDQPFPPRFPPHGYVNAHPKYTSSHTLKGGYNRLSEESEVMPQMRPSVMLPALQLSEKKFFQLVNSGDVGAVKSFLEDNPGFNINCVNFQGVSALQIAVQINSEPMVELLLEQKNIDIGDTVLHAIRDNKPKILEMLLEKLNATSPGLEFVGATHSSDFPDHITPLILASQCGHYEIIEMLTERGHRISKPHSPSCRCQECKAGLDHDDLLHSESLRLNLYRAVCNPAYICHTTFDPILEAFQLSKELKESSSLVPEFRAAYMQLSEEVSTFAVELVGCCRSTEEVELILCQKNGMDAPHSFAFPRVELAMDYKQKEFVAHPNTQQIIETAWHGGWHEWKLKPLPVKVAYPFIRLLMLPIIAIMCLVMPKHNLVKHWQVPLNKMMTHTSSYFLFLVIIFLQSNMDKTGQGRGPPNSGLEPIIMVYVLGYVWRSLRLCIIQGIKRHFRGLWAWNDMIMDILFMLTFAFWLTSYFDVQKNDQADLERKYWHHLDPILLAEGTFAIGTIMAFFRLLYLCRLNFYLGPLQISLGKMSADMAKYLTIFAIIIVSFSAGMCRFYQAYDGMVQVDPSSGIKTAQAGSFVDFKSTLKTFFWALFCMSSLESADVVIENLPGETDNSTIINKHTFTEAVGYIAFALFEVLTVIMILNMLIATMSNTFQRVTDNVDIEWTFGKTDFYLEHMLETTLPAPLNLLPTAAGLGAALEWVKVYKQNPPGKVASCSPLSCCYIETAEDEQMTKDFPILMSQLVQRYFREKDAGADKPAVDLESIKQDLAEIKELLQASRKR